MDLLTTSDLIESHVELLFTSLSGQNGLSCLLTDYLLYCYVRFGCVACVLNVYFIVK